MRLAGGADYEERLPLEPDYVLAWGDVIQAFYLLEEPALRAEAKPVAVALQEHAGCDAATADLASGWWIAGSFRYGPKGEAPVRVVKRWDGESRTRLVDLQEALGLQSEMLRPKAAGWPKPLRVHAFHGFVGKAVNTLLPHTEADPAALLVHLLVAFGNAVGRGPHARVEADRHGANLYAAFIGETGAGRKGTAGGRISELFTVADPNWAKHCVNSGMSSGVGVIEAIGDPLEEKRLFLRESELSRMFRAITRHGLLDTLLKGWDGSDLEVLTKKPMRATEPHISIAGDITVDDVRKLRRDVITSGLINRFLLVCTSRSKLLPEGGRLTDADINELGSQLREALEAARKIGLVERDRAAGELWAKMYVELSAVRPWLFGAATSRAAPQVVRLSVIYALFDGSAIVRRQHLIAAREVWRYCEDSARYVLGQSLDPTVDKLLLGLRSAPDDGLSRTQIQDLLGRHVPVDEIQRALASLEAMGLATKSVSKTGRSTCDPVVRHIMTFRRGRGQGGSGTSRLWSLWSPHSLRAAPCTWSARKGARHPRAVRARPGAELCVLRPKRRKRLKPEINKLGQMRSAEKVRPSGTSSRSTRSHPASASPARDKSG